MGDATEDIKKVFHRSSQYVYSEALTMKKNFFFFSVSVPQFNIVTLVGLDLQS